MYSKELPFFIAWQASSNRNFTVPEISVDCDGAILALVSAPGIKS
jgi:hypothetical protein